MIRQRWLLFVTIMGLILHLSNCVSNKSVGLSAPTQTSKPYLDTRQIIPGKLQAEFFDLGGEGIAYHDVDSTNSGSGGLNPADGTVLNEFRIHEAVDISYTKVDDRHIDNNPFNLVDPEKDQLYVGWTEPGEWTRYSVKVEKTGAYQVGLMYTSQRGGRISVSENGIDLTGQMDVLSTFNAADSIQWRNWHHWNFADSLGSLELKAGQHILQLNTVSEGNMNYNYLVFTLLNPESNKTN